MYKELELTNHVTAIINASKHSDITYLSTSHKKIFMFDEIKDHKLLFRIYVNMSREQIAYLLKYNMIKHYILNHPEYRIDDLCESMSLL